MMTTLIDTYWMNIRIGFLLLILPVILFFGTGCSTLSNWWSGGSKTIGQKEGKAYTVEALHQDLLGYASHFEAVIRSTSSNIASRAGSRDIRRRSLLWKVKLVPLANELATRDDTQEAFVSLALLTEVMKHYFTEGDGKNIFGPHQELAIEAAEQLEDRILSIGSDFLSNKQEKKLRTQIMTYARQHPIRGKDFSVESIENSLQEVDKGDNILSTIINIPLAPFSALQGVGSTPAAIRDFNRTSQSLVKVVENMPRIVRWQAELLAYDLEDRETISTTLDELEKFNQTARQLTTQVEQWPEDVEQILKKTSDETKNLNRTVDNVRNLIKDSESLVTKINDAKKEWEPLLKDDEQEPAKTPEDQTGLEEYRKTLQETDRTAQSLQQLAVDIKSLLESKGVPSTSSKLRSLGRQTEQSGKNVINHAFWRGIQLLLALFVLMFVYRTTVYFLFRSPASQTQASSR